MQIENAIRARRAVKSFDANAPMDEATFSTLITLAQETPSSFNIQHWRIVRVKDKALRESIKEAAWGQSQITDAAELLVVCADVKAWEKEPQRYWENAPKEAQDTLLPMIQNFYHGKEQLQRDEALRSVGLISQTIMLAAQGLGYDSCPMIGFDAQRVAELIHLPHDHVIGMVIAVGKALQPARPKGGTLPVQEIITTDRFA